MTSDQIADEAWEFFRAMRNPNWTEEQNVKALVRGAMTAPLIEIDSLRAEVEALTSGRDALLRLHREELETLRAEIASQREISIKVAAAIDAVHQVNDDLERRTQDEAIAYKALAKSYEAMKLQVERYRKGLEDVLRTAPGIFVPASDTEPAFTCSCCRSKDGYVRGALGIAVAEKPKCAHVFINYQCEKCGVGQDVEKPFHVEGKPGEVCGPCGVAHPVAEKRVDESECPNCLKMFRREGPRHILCGLCESDAV